MDSFEILVIVLSIMLAIFLALGIVMLIISIRIMNRVDAITKKAEDFADNLQEASEFFRNTAAPIAASKMIANIIEWARKSNKKKGD